MSPLGVCDLTEATSQRRPLPGAKGEVTLIVFCHSSGIWSSSKTQHGKRTTMQGCSQFPVLTLS
jgi:hypothetical protein